MEVVPTFGSGTNIWRRDQHLEVGPTFGGGTNIWRWNQHLEVEPTFGGGTNIWRREKHLEAGPTFYFGGRTDLSQTFLSGPHRRVDDLEEELTSSRVEDKDRSVDWLRRQVTLECLSRGTTQRLSHVTTQIASRDCIPVMFTPEPFLLTTAQGVTC